MLSYSLAFFVIFFLFVRCNAHAQPSPIISVKQYPLNELKIAGAPQALMVDNNDRVWIGTTNGISVFDGTGFTAYYDADGLPDNFVTDLEMSPDGTVFVATSKGVCRYTGNPARPFERLKNLDSFYFTASILPLGNNTVLAGDLKFGGLRPWGSESSLPGISGTGIANSCLDLAKNKKGILYFSESDHVFVFNGKGFDSVRIRPNTQSWARLYPGNGPNTMWCAGEKLYRLEGNRFTDSLPLPPNQVIDRHMFAITSDGRLIGGTNILWVNNSGRWDTLLNEKQLNGTIDRIVTGRDGIIWLCGTFGLIKMSFVHGVSDVSQLLRAGFTAADGQFLTSVVGDHDTADFATIKKATGSYPAAYRDRTGQFWYLTQKGLYKKVGGVLKFLPAPVSETGIVLPCLSIIEDNRNRVWFGTEHGVYFYNGQDFITPEFKSKVEQPYEQIYYMANGRDNQLYIAGLMQIFAFEPGDPKNTLQSLDPRNTLNCSGIVSNGKGEVWGIADHVISQITIQPNGQIRAADTIPKVKIGGMAIPLESITFDKHNNMWAVSGQYMLAYLRQSQGNVYRDDKKFIFTQNDLPGLLQPTGFPAMISDSNGKIFVIGNGKTYLLEPDTLLQEMANLTAPRLRISRIEVNGNVSDWVSQGYKLNNGLPANPEFTDSVFSILFYCSGYTSRNQEYVTYEYKLDGFNDNWINNGNSGIISFNGLAPGKYLLNVRARDINNTASNIVSYHFTILPPWYKRWWAIVLWTGIGGLVFTLLFLLRLRAVKRKAALQRLVLENELKALRAQINPHFLQNTFNFLSEILEEQPVKYTRKVILQLSDYLRHVLDRTEQPVVTLEDELAFAQEYLDINQLLFPGGFSYKIDIDNDVDTIVPMVPSMLLQPLLENALKHGVRQQQDPICHIAVRVCNEEPYIVIMISNTIPEDNHNGRIPGNNPIGLKNTEQRLKLLYSGASQQPVFNTSIEAPENDAGRRRYTVIIKIP